MCNNVNNTNCDIWESGPLDADYYADGFFYKVTDKLLFWNNNYYCWGVSGYSFHELQKLPSFRQKLMDRKCCTSAPKPDLLPIAKDKLLSASTATGERRKTLLQEVITLIQAELLIK